MLAINCKLTRVNLAYFPCRYPHPIYSINNFYICQCYTLTLLKKPVAIPLQLISSGQRVSTENSVTPKL